MADGVVAVVNTLGCCKRHPRVKWCGRYGCEWGTGGFSLRFVQHNYKISPHSRDFSLPPIFFHVAVGFWHLRKTKKTCRFQKATCEAGSREISRDSGRVLELSGNSCGVIDCGISEVTSPEGLTQSCIVHQGHCVTVVCRGRPHCPVRSHSVQAGYPQSTHFSNLPSKESNVFGGHVRQYVNYHHLAIISGSCSCCSACTLPACLFWPSMRPP